MSSKRPEVDDFIENEDPYAVLGEFDELKQSEKSYQDWSKRYNNDPGNVLTEQNLDYLASLTPGKRLLDLSLGAGFLKIRPSDLKEYFERFPEDIGIVSTMFSADMGHLDSSVKFQLISLAIPYFVDTLPDYNNGQWSSYIRQYAERAARREEAPAHLITGYNGGLPFQEKFGEFGPAAESLLAVIKEASELEMHGDHFLDPRPIFGPEYENLKPDEKAKFLRQAIKEIQYDLVFDEANNSAFTRERVEEDRLRSKEMAREYGRATHNRAHSMLFGTYQPNFAYAHKQEIFEREMRSTADVGGSLEEYPFHRILVALVKEIGNSEAQKSENVDLLVELWDKNRNPIFINSIAEALSQQDPNRAAAKLMEMIRAESRDKHALAAVLYRIELGRIGMSREGAQYLERLYDLGEMNNPDYFAHRLTSTGQMGVFDSQNKLLKLFDLGDLAEENKVVVTKTYDLTIEILSKGKDNESPEEKGKRLEILSEFKSKYISLLESKVLANSGTRLNNLSLREQAMFLQYIESASEEKSKNVNLFLKLHGEAGLRTFLALDQKPGLGEQIIAFGNKHTALSERVFIKFAEIVDATTEEDPEIEKSLQDRAARLLEKFIKRGLNEVDESGLLNELNEIEKGNELFLATYKALPKEAREEALKESRDIFMQEISGKELSEEDRREMRRIYEENYKAAKYSELKPLLLQAFDKSLEDQTARFTLFKYKNKVRGFLRFTTLSGGETYFGAFNVDRHFAGAEIGETLIDVALEKEAKLNVILADCEKDSSISKRYLARGFKIVDEYDLAGVPSLKIKRDDLVKTQSATA